MSEQVLGFLGLMRRAGALAVGAEDAFDAARENKARVLVMAGDVAKNTVSAMHNAAAQREEGIPLIKLDSTKRELGTAVGVKECAALAVLDTGFALALCQKLEKSDLIPRWKSVWLGKRNEKPKKKQEKKQRKNLRRPRASGRAAPSDGSPKRKAVPDRENPAPIEPKIPQRAANALRGSKSRASTEKGGTELW